MGNPASSSSSHLLLPPPNPTHHRHSSPSSTNLPSPELKPKLESTTNPNPTIPSSPPRKNLPLPWTHQETVNLIQAYQEKWYSLNKGQLKASQWEEVAVTVAARCGYDEPSKSATQCRHKIEKLRKRYRAERVRPYQNLWQYFELMDNMERGPLPIAARPLAAVKYPNSNSASDYVESDSDEGDVDYSGVDARKNKLKSINNIVRGDRGLSSRSNRYVNRMTMDRNFGGGGGGGNEGVLSASRKPVSEKRKAYFGNDESGEEEGEDEDEEEGEEKVVDRRKEVAAEIRGFAERYMRMENKKIEMMRETERCRMEMEKKRMAMIDEAQRKIVETIGTAFRGS